MPTINIKVKDKIAHQTGNERYICGNSDFTVEFDFDSEWDAAAAKTARFKYNGVHQDVLFTGNVCPVPKIMDAVAIQIGVFAGDLRTTTAAIVPARRCILSGDSVHEDPPEDVYNQLMAMLEDIIKRLEALENGGGGTPDEPDVPDVTKLATPTIRLETVSDSAVKLATPTIRLESSDMPDSGTLTPAILGVAILGRTILGKTDVEDSTAQQLAAPTIRLEAVEDGGEEEPDEPVVQQLAAPVISLEVVADDEPEPEPSKLAVPVIELKTVVYALTAPVIKLEEV